MGFVNVDEAFVKVLRERGGEQWNNLLPSSILNPGSIVSAKINSGLGWRVYI
jgi:hypothetical protein